MSANPRGVYAITKTATAEALVKEACQQRPGVPVATLFRDALAEAVERRRGSAPTADPRARLRAAIQMSGTNKTALNSILGCRDNFVYDYLRGTIRESPRLHAWTIAVETGFDAIDAAAETKHVPMLRGPS